MVVEVCIAAARSLRMIVSAYVAPSSNSIEAKITLTLEPEHSERDFARHRSIRIYHIHKTDICGLGDGKVHW